MMLDDLYELIETLQARIAQHDSALQQSEALTRYALIDPLLRGLGWDTGDPAQVLVEFRSPAGSADYALLGTSSKPQVIIEAKRLGTHLDPKVRQQVTSYCQEEGVPFAVITDGKRWEIYDIFQRAAMKDSIVATLDLGDAAAKISLQALALWRPSAVEGSIIVGAAPVVDTPLPVQHMPAAPTPIVELGMEWRPLSEFQPERGTKPAAIRHSNGQVKAVDSWADLCAEIVRWLKSSGRLTEQHLPVRIGRGQVYFVNRSNANGKGTQFKTYRQVDSWFVNANYNAKQQANNARGVIQTAGLDPATFAVKLQ